MWLAAVVGALVGLLIVLAVRGAASRMTNQQVIDESEKISKAIRDHFYAKVGIIVLPDWLTKDNTH